MPQYARLLSIIPLLLAAIFLLNACSTGPGYGGSGKWKYDKEAQRPAKQPPSPISEIYGKDAPPVTQEQKPAEAPTENIPAAINNDLPIVKVAILLPLSGTHKTLGEAMLKSAQIALFDMGHATFELEPQDTKGTASGAREAAQKAIKGGAQLILGPLFADSVKGAKTITEPARIPMIAFSTDWTLAGGNTFIMGFLPFDQIERLTQFISNKNIYRVGLITPSTSYGQVVTNAFESLAPRYNIQTTERTEFPPQTSNLAPVVRKFSRYDSRQAVKDPQNALPPPFDAVLMPVGGNQASAISSLLSHYDLPPSKVKRLGTGLMDDTALATESSLLGTWFAAPSPYLRESFEKKFRAAYGYSAPRLSTLSYDATALAAILARQGLERGGRPDFSRSAILNPNGFFGIDGIFRFRNDGTAERGLAILEFSRGGIRVIDEPPTTFEQRRY